MSVRLDMIKEDDKEVEDSLPQDGEQITRSKEYNETVMALPTALADIHNSDKWPTHEEVFAELREKHGITSE